MSFNNLFIVLGGTKKCCIYVRGKYLINFEPLLEEWKHKNIYFVIDVVEKFCNKNNLDGIDGIYGFLCYVKK